MTTTEPAPRPFVVVQAGARWGITRRTGGPLLVGGLTLVAALTLARRLNRRARRAAP